MDMEGEEARKGWIRRATFISMTGRWCGQQGNCVRSTRVRLQSQPLLVLESLLSQPGEMVTREQLIARLWPNGVVVDFDTALNSAIRRLRTALADHAENPRYIETIPRRGYRFIGHVPGMPDLSPAEPVAVTTPDCTLRPR
jgi:DNA-binding winged helix-turn-helix (wHTH) protein